MCARRLCLVLTATSCLAAPGAFADDPQFAEVNFRKGAQALAAGDADAAMSYFKRSAREDDARAKYAIGYLHLQGLGTEKDPERGAKWIRKAARQGYPDAQRAYGALHLEGLGVDPDAEEGVEWLRKAAECGDAEAQATLGRLAHEGRGLPRDEVAAYVWLSLAAAQDDARAARDRDVLAARLEPAQRAAGDAQVAAFEPQSPGWRAPLAVQADMDSVFSAGRGVGSRDW